jgi:nucleoside-diphosphate kinase
MGEQTLVLIKPDGVRRGLIGEVIGRFERRGLAIRAIKMLKFDENLVSQHYGEHIGKPFFPSLREFIRSGPVVALIVEGVDAIQLVRNMMGATKAVDALPGSIRGDFATITTENIVHGSDSPERAEIEKSLFFKPEEIF